MMYAIVLACFTTPLVPTGNSFLCVHRGGEHLILVADLPTGNVPEQERLQAALAGPTMIWCGVRSIEADGRYLSDCETEAGESLVDLLSPTQGNGS